MIQHLKIILVKFKVVLLIKYLGAFNLYTLINIIDFAEKSIKVDLLHNIIKKSNLLDDIQKLIYSYFYLDL